MRLSRVFARPRALVRAMGFDVVRYTAGVTGANARRLRALQDHRVDVVLDVGAAEGEFGGKLRRSGYRGRIVSFEPLGASFEKLRAVAERDGAWEAVHTAIGDRDGEASINVSGRSTSSSLLPMAPRHVEAAPDSAYVGRESTALARLDTALRGLIRPQDRLYLKMDVQGYEGAVLAGAAHTLAATKLVEVEVSTVPLYEGGMLYAQMIATLDGLGFRLISWEDVLTDPHTGYVLQADCIFARAA